MAMVSRKKKIDYLIVNMVKFGVILEIVEQIRKVFLPKIYNC